MFRKHGLRLQPLHPVLVTRRDKRLEQRMRLQRLRLELGMELAAQEIRMSRQLDNLYISRVRGGAADGQPAAREQRLVFTIEFIPVPMPLADLRRSTVSLRRERVLLQDASPRAQSHRAAHLFHTKQLAQLVNDAVLAGRVELDRKSTRLNSSHRCIS